jgi:hypothetical protein
MNAAMPSSVLYQVVRLWRMMSLELHDRHFEIQRGKGVKLMRETRREKQSQRRCDERKDRLSSSA